MKNLSHSIAVVLGLFCCLAIHAQTQEKDRIFIVYDASNGLVDNSAQTVMCTKTGRMMVTTLGHVNFFDGESFSHVDPKSSDAFPLPGYDGSYQVYFDRLHHLWIKNDHMMTCVNLSTETFIHDVPATMREMGINGKVDDFYGDGESNVWFRMGHKLYSPGAQKQFMIRSTAVLQDVDVLNDSLFFMFHADGSVVVYDYKTGHFLRQDVPSAEQNAISYSHSSEICLIGRQYFQLRNDNGMGMLMRYDTDRHEWSSLLKTDYRLTALCPRGDLLYIGSYQGYIVYNIKTGLQQHLKTLTLTKGRTQLAHVTSIVFDRQGGLWIGTERRGLLYCKPYPSPFMTYHRESATAHHYRAMLDRMLKKPQKPLPRKVNCIFTDTRGWQWTGSYSGLELQKPDGTTQVFNSLNGLTNDVVHSIAEDTQHDIWISTSFGILHVFIRNGEVTHIEPYINQDNVPNEMFLNGRAATLPDGTIVMESLDHIVTFNASKFHAEQFGGIAINPKLTRLSVNGYQIKAGEKLDGQVVVDKAVARSKHINVNYDQNSVFMTFSALNYLRPIQTYYKVRVKGVPGFQDWRILSCTKSNGMVNKYGHLHLNLLGLEPGDYKVEIQTSLWPETWPEEPYVWEIHVDQPWWRTTGLYLTLLLVFVALLLLNLMAFNRNLRLRLRRTNEEADILHRIKSLVARCQSLSTEEIKADDIASAVSDMEHDGLSDDFVNAMLYIVPYVSHYGGQLHSVSHLASVAGIDPMKLYDMLSSHIDKSPRLLMLPLRLQHAAQLLLSTNSSVEEIARQCHFASTNYFIAAFYRRYKKNPMEYRRGL